jgi:cell division transport system ATP-binding protein
MILFEDVTKMYRGAPKPALSNVSINIGAGEFVFLVGASGSGKSSFLRLILKEERPNAGNIHVLGQDLRRIPSRKVPLFRRNLGVVFQDFRLLPQKTVFDNVAFTLRVIGQSSGFIHEAVPDILQTVGLAQKAKNYPHELSGGEQQMLTLCRTLMGDPDLIIIDEPTEGLAPKIVELVGQFLFSLKAKGVSVLLIEQKLTIAMSISDRALVMGHGAIVFQGTPDELRANTYIRKEWLEV